MHREWNGKNAMLPLLFSSGSTHVRGRDANSKPPHKLAIGSASSIPLNGRTVARSKAPFSCENCKWACAAAVVMGLPRRSICAIDDLAFDSMLSMSALTPASPTEHP
eukprot:scaffold199168_cov32-Tisochrysis_lutea.AAC.2